MCGGAMLFGALLFGALLFGALLFGAGTIGPPGALAQTGLMGTHPGTIRKVNINIRKLLNLHIEIIFFNQILVMTENLLTHSRLNVHFS